MLSLCPQGRVHVSTRVPTVCHVPGRHRVDSAVGPRWVGGADMRAELQYDVLSAGNRSRGGRRRAQRRDSPAWSRVTSEEASGLAPACQVCSRQAGRDGERECRGHVARPSSVWGCPSRDRRPDAGNWAVLFQQWEVSKDFFF